MNRIPLGSLKAFEAVARRGSVTDAAAEMFVTPGAVSQQIRSLEGNLQIALFRRERNRMILTQPGQQLADSLIRSFRDIDAAVRGVRETTSDDHVRLAVTGAFAQYWLIPRLRSFYDRNPDYLVQIWTIPRFQDLQLSDVDFGLYSGDTLPEGTEGVCVFDNVLVPVCTPEIAANIHSPGDVLARNLLESMAFPNWDLWIDDQGLADVPTRRTKFLSGALVLSAALGALGIALSQVGYAERYIEQRSLTICGRPLVKRDIKHFLIYNPETIRRKSTRAFLEWLRVTAAPSA